MEDLTALINREQQRDYSHSTRPICTISVDRFPGKDGLQDRSRL